MAIKIDEEKCTGCGHCMENCPNRAIFLVDNKAVINESEQDKIIRQLREENLDLKKLIEDLNKKIMLNNGVIGEDDKLQFLEMKEQYEANNRAVEDLGKIYFIYLFI